jgi:polyisoprenoid-binding protein YceI
MLRLLAFLTFILPVNIYAGQNTEPNPTYQVVLKPQSKLWLTGDSTLHPYSSTATVVNLQTVFQPLSTNPSLSFDEKLFQAKVLVFKVTIPVTGLKSGEKGLDKNMYKALNAAQFPSIEFRLTDEYLLVNSSGTGLHQLASTGVLSVAGKENAIQLNSQFEVLPGELHVLGTAHLLMTDYGVKPPTILAVIKTKNDVTIHFDLLLGPSDAKK